MKDRLRVLFVNEAALHGAHVLGPVQLENALRAGLQGRDDIEARFATADAAGPVVRTLARDVPGLRELDLDLQPLRWHVAHGARAARSVRRELARWDADAVYVNSQAIAMLMRGEMRRRPFFLSVDATAWEWQRMGAARPLRAHSHVLFAPNIALERRAFTAAHTVLAWTQWAGDLVRRAAPRANVVVLHPGIDLDRFRPAQRTERERPRVLFVGGRFESKGGFDLLRAVDDLLGAELELDVVTPAELAPRAGLRVHRLGPDDPRLAELHRQADLFCLPTYADTMGFAILEAMASGAPVVATDVGAIPEVVGQGEAGIVIEKGDTQALRTVIETLLGDDSLRASLGTAARARCERDYDARRQVGRLVELMRAAVA